jgi:hypothetical protein
MIIYDRKKNEIKQWETHFMVKRRKLYQIISKTSKITKIVAQKCLKSSKIKMTQRFKLRVATNEATMRKHEENLKSVKN